MKENISKLGAIKSAAISTVGNTAAIAKKKLEELNEKDRQARQAEMQRNLASQALSQYSAVASLLMQALNSASEVLNLPHVKDISQLASKNRGGFTSNGKVYLEYAWFYKEVKKKPAKEVARTLQDALDDLVMFNNLPRLKVAVQYRPNYRLVIRVVAA